MDPFGSIQQMPLPPNFRQDPGALRKQPLPLDYRNEGGTQTMDQPAGGGHTLNFYFHPQMDRLANQVHPQHQIFRQGIQGAPPSGVNNTAAQQPNSRPTQTIGMATPTTTEYPSGMWNQLMDRPAGIPGHPMAAPGATTMHQVGNVPVAWGPGQGNPAIANEIANMDRQSMYRDQRHAGIMESQNQGLGMTPNKYHGGSGIGPYGQAAPMTGVNEVGIGGPSSVALQDARTQQRGINNIEAQAAAARDAAYKANLTGLDAAGNPTPQHAAMQAWHQKTGTPTVENATTEQLSTPQQTAAKIGNVWTTPGINGGPNQPFSLRDQEIKTANMLAEKHARDAMVDPGMAARRGLVTAIAQERHPYAPARAQAMNIQDPTMRAAMLGEIANQTQGLRGGDQSQGRDRAQRNEAGFGVLAASNFQQQQLAQQAVLERERLASAERIEGIKASGDRSGKYRMGEEALMQAELEKFDKDNNGASPIDLERGHAAIKRKYEQKPQGATPIAPVAATEVNGANKPSSTVSDTAHPPVESQELIDARALHPLKTNASISDAIDYADQYYKDPSAWWKFLTVDRRIPPEAIAEVHANNEPGTGFSDAFSGFSPQVLKSILNGSYHPKYLIDLANWVERGKKIRAAMAASAGLKK